MASGGKGAGEVLLQWCARSRDDFGSHAAILAGDTWSAGGRRFFARERLATAAASARSVPPPSGSASTLIQGHLARLDGVAKALPHYSLESYDDDDAGAGTRSYNLSNDASILEVVLNSASGGIKSVEFGVCEGDEETLWHHEEVNAELLGDLRRGDKDEFCVKLDRLLCRAAHTVQESGLRRLAEHLLKTDGAGMGPAPGPAQVWGQALRLFALPATLTKVVVPGVSDGLTTATLPRGGDFGGNRRDGGRALEEGAWSCVPSDTLDSSTCRAGSMECTVTLEVATAPHTPSMHAPIPGYKDTDLCQLTFDPPIVMPETTLVHVIGLLDSALPVSTGARPTHSGDVLDAAAATQQEQEQEQQREEELFEECSVVHVRCSPASSSRLALTMATRRPEADGGVFKSSLPYMPTRFRRVHRLPIPVAAVVQVGEEKGGGAGGPGGLGARLLSVLDVIRREAVTSWLVSTALPCLRSPRARAYPWPAVSYDSIGLIGATHSSPSPVVLPLFIDMDVTGTAAGEAEGEGDAARVGRNTIHLRVGGGEAACHSRRHARLVAFSLTIHVDDDVGAASGLPEAHAPCGSKCRVWSSAPVVDSASAVRRSRDGLSESEVEVPVEGTPLCSSAVATALLKECYSIPLLVHYLATNFALCPRNAGSEAGPPKAKRAKA